MDCSKCHKHFETKSGLFKHAKKCNDKTTMTINPPVTSHSILTGSGTSVEPNALKLLQACLDRLETLEEHLKTSAPIKSPNRTVYDVFLNEYCNDAMNIMDFMQSIPSTISDTLDHIASTGYVQTIASVMVNALHTLPLTQRPIHCTDLRNQTLYVKHADKWQLATPECPAILHAVHTLRERLLGRSFNELNHKQTNILIVKSICKDIKLSKQDILSTYSSSDVQ
jgi:hypothetical protein